MKSVILQPARIHQKPEQIRLRVLQPRHRQKLVSHHNPPMNRPRTPIPALSRLAETKAEPRSRLLAMAIPGDDRVTDKGLNEAEAARRKTKKQKQTILTVNGNEVTATPRTEDDDLISQMLKDMERQMVIHTVNDDFPRNRGLEIGEGVRPSKAPILNPTRGFQRVSGR